MRIGLVAPPFISVPPKQYGGTELFIAHLARGLKKLDIEAVVYTNGESSIEVEKRWLYDRPQWPIQGEVHDNLKDINHTAWAVRDASETCDLVHLNNMPGLTHSRFLDLPFVYTVHHPHHPELSEFYRYHPQVHYVTISEFQLRRENLPRIRAIHHGIDTSIYQCRERKQPYLSFIGRIAPIKGTHLAVQVALKSGIPLKIAGEVQPIFRDYFDREIKPYVDGKLIEYVGEADHEAKNELLSNSLAMLFPIQWDEPFGLVMIEAMACGTPVLALPGGSVQEIVREGVAGCICDSVDSMAKCAGEIESRFSAKTVRNYVEQFFSVERMVADYARLYAEILGAKATEICAEKEKRAAA